MKDVYFVLQTGYIFKTVSPAGMFTSIEDDSVDASRDYQVDGLWWYGTKQYRVPTILYSSQVQFAKIVSEKEAWEAAEKVG